MTEQLTGRLVEGLDKNLIELWRERSEIAPGRYTWEKVIASVKEVAYVAAGFDGLTPAQVIDRQIDAVRRGLVDGRYANSTALYATTAPFCGCLIGWAGHAVGMEIDVYAMSTSPLFGEVRGRRAYAPAEILAFLLRPGDSDTPQAALVIRALEQAQAELAS